MSNSSNTRASSWRALFVTLLAVVLGLNLGMSWGAEQRAALDEGAVAQVTTQHGQGVLAPLLLEAELEEEDDDDDDDDERVSDQHGGDARHRFELHAAASQEVTRPLGDARGALLSLRVHVGLGARGPP